MTNRELKALWQALSGLQRAYHMTAPELVALVSDVSEAELQRGFVSQDVPVSTGTQRNISLFLGIHGGLKTLFPDSQQATTWIDRPNELPPFNGATPRTLMFSGSASDLASVRKFIDYWLE